jgi:hypothetical protein
MDLRETMDLPDTSRDNLLLDYLQDATAMIDQACGRTFFRIPQVSGTVTFHVDIVDPYATSLLRASGSGYTVEGYPLDIVSLTTLGYREGESDSTYTNLTAGDTGYYLDSSHPSEAGDVWPYQDVRLSPNGSITRWYGGKRAIEGVGVLGFPRVPRAVRRACLDLAREMYRQGPGGGPSQVGINQFGVPVFLQGMPWSFKTLVAPGSPYRRQYVV